MNFKKCIGYGEFEGKCHYVTVDNPHWCPRCDKLRKEHITKQLKAIAAEMGIVLEESEVEHDGITTTLHSQKEVKNERKEGF